MVYVANFFAACKNLRVEVLYIIILCICCKHEAVRMCVVFYCSIDITRDGSINTNPCVLGDIHHTRELPVYYIRSWEV